MFTNKTSKANNLLRLLKNQKKFIVPIFITIFKKDLKNKIKLQKKINKIFKQNERLIVRSSSLLEDTLNKSNAGKFLSISDVKNINQNVIDAIENVSKKLRNNDQIIIQKFKRRYFYP